MTSVAASILTEAATIVDGVRQQTHGVKHDGGKDPWHLMPTDAARAIVKVLGFGAAKYAPRNWEKGMAWSRPYSALQRHLTAWWEGERQDPETGFSHLWHAGCCIVFLIAYELRHVGQDDRPLATRPHPLAGDPIEEQMFGPVALAGELAGVD